MLTVGDPAIAVGDRLVVRAHRQGQLEQDAEILEVLSGERAAYRVRWSDGRESIIYPGTDVFVEHYRRRGQGAA
jgi:hypothetical protein